MVLYSAEEGFGIVFAMQCNSLLSTALKLYLELVDILMMDVFLKKQHVKII